MFCPNCGNQIPDGHSFCSNCGLQVVNNYVNQQTPYTPQPAPKKGVNLVGIFAIVAVVAVGIAAGSWLFGGEDPDDRPTGQVEDRDDRDQEDHAQESTEEPTEQTEPMVTVYLPTRMEKTIYGDQTTVWVETYAYDEQGNMITLTQYKPDGTRNYTYTMAYDGAGNMIRREYHGSAIYIDEYEYDSLGRQICISDNGSKNSAEYDEQGRLIRFQENGEDEYRVYVYAGDGLSCRSSEYRADGSLVEYTDIYYDDRGNIVSTWRYTAEGSLLYRTDYVFDEANHHTQTLCYAFCSADHVGTSYSFTYDEYGNLIREDFNGDYYSGDHVKIYTVEPVEVLESAARRLGQ